MNTPNITDWISAISTAALGVLGAVFGLWQWNMAKFRPKPSVQIDAQGEAIALQIVNKGRANGVIERVQTGELKRGRASRAFLVITTGRWSWPQCLLC